MKSSYVSCTSVCVKNRRHKPTEIRTESRGFSRGFLVMTAHLCNLCPRRCNTDRDTPEGFKRALCRSTWAPKVALVSLHAWEEPCLSGKNGAGTVFFSHCTMRCCFCQNYPISHEGKGLTVSPERLRDIFLEQQYRKSSCLELVTPSHYAEILVFALKEAKKAGLTIPVVYNTNAYDLPETLRRFDGLVDIFMPDLKYFDSRYGARYSGVPDYFDIARLAIQTMFDLVGPVQKNISGLMTRGVLIRHLVLPWLWRDSCRCLDWLYGTFGDAVVVSIMNQYMPLFKATRHPEINRPLTTLEYQRVLKHAEKLGMSNVYVQVGKTNSDIFIPIFDGSHVLTSHEN